MTLMKTIKDNHCTNPVRIQPGNYHLTIRDSKKTGSVVVTLIIVTQPSVIKSQSNNKCKIN